MEPDPQKPDALHDIRSSIWGSGIEIRNLIVDGCHAVDVLSRDNKTTIECRQCSYVWTGDLH